MLPSAVLRIEDEGTADGAEVDRFEVHAERAFVLRVC
jgi:hypothetical protein